MGQALAQPAGYANFLTSRNLYGLDRQYFKCLLPYKLIGWICLMKKTKKKFQKFQKKSEILTSRINPEIPNGRRSFNHSFNRTNIGVRLLLPLVVVTEWFPVHLRLIR